MMSAKQWGMAVMGSMAAAVLMIAIYPASVSAQAGKAETQPARPERKKEAQGREMAFVGKIVDLQSFMTGQFSSDDHAKSIADALKNGAPAAIDTPMGLIAIGQGSAGPSKMLIPLVGKRVKISGKFYEKNGLKYIDLATASAASDDPAEREESQE